MDLTQSQIEFYHKLADTYDSEVDTERIFKEQLYKRFFAEDVHYGTSLDIGCGTGNWTRGLLDVCDKVLAIDSSSRMLELCREKLDSDRITYQKVNVFDLPDLGRFDLIFSTFWISHVPFQLQDAFWDWISRSLNHPGKILMQDSTDRGPGGGGSVRTLPSGEEYEIVKNNYDFNALLAIIRKYGIEASVTMFSDTIYLISGEKV